MTTWHGGEETAHPVWSTGCVGETWGGWPRSSPPASWSFSGRIPAEEATPRPRRDSAGCSPTTAAEPATGSRTSGRRSRRRHPSQCLILVNRRTGRRRGTSAATGGADLQELR